MELGRPPPEWHSAVAYGETQVVNSNSTSSGKETPTNILRYGILAVNFHNFLFLLQYQFLMI